MLCDFFIASIIFKYAFVFTGDRKLFLSLIFDAMVTEWFTNNVSTASAEEKG